MAGTVAGVVDIDDADGVVVFVDQAERGDADLLVDTQALAGVAGLRLESAGNGRNS
ncbi:MAG: hypothetical protein AAF078_00025 [Planctomycetota bacterium]